MTLKMHLIIVFLCIASSAFVGAFDVNNLNAPQTDDDNNIQSIDDQVEPLGTDNVFCLFTYGNWVMDSSMRQDIPSAINAGVARLPFHRLDFSYFSQDLKGSFPTIVPDCGYEVWGTVYLIPVQDLDQVLLKGGIVDNKKIFHLIHTTVEAYSNGNVINVKCNAFQQTSLPEKMIYGLPLPQGRKPSQQILDMLTEAYSDGGLPKKYIDEVSQIPTIDEDYIETNLTPTSQPQQKPTVVVAPDSVVVAPDSVVVQPDQGAQVTTTGYAVPPMQHTNVAAQPVNNQP